MAFIVFSGKFCWTMGKVDLALMNVYYISAHATLGFELTSFRILYDSSCPSFRFSHSFFACFPFSPIDSSKWINLRSIWNETNLSPFQKLFQNWNQQFNVQFSENIFKKNEWLTSYDRLVSDIWTFERI